VNRSQLVRSMGQSLSLVVLLLAIGTPAAIAQKVYKSIDADGVVTYSSSPPRNAPVDQIDTINIAPGPSEAARAAGQQRLMESQRRVLEESIDRRERNNPSADQGVAQGAAASNTPNRQSITDALAEQLQRSRSTSRDTRPAGAGGNSSRSRSSR
jgi:hypothetical protein